MVWLYIRTIGVRFYQNNHIPKSKEYRHTQCVTYSGNKITFKFHLVENIELSYRGDKVKGKTKKALLIHAEYDDSLPEEIRKWNNLTFYFPGVPAWFHKERIISEMMLLAYLDFIRSYKTRPNG